MKFFAGGGTTDKVYFDKKSEYQVGKTMLNGVLKQVNVSFEHECESLIQKDSLDMTDEDRQFLFDKIESDENSYIVVTHGTDTMIATARKLQTIENKVVVFTGAM